MAASVPEKISVQLAQISAINLVVETWCLTEKSERKLVSSKSNGKKGSRRRKQAR